MTDGMHDEDPADVHADMVLTAQGESYEQDLDPSDFADTAPPLILFPVSPGAPELVGAYGRVYTRTDETEPDGEPIWQDEDGDYGTKDELESALARAEAHEAMGGDAPF